MHKLAYLIPPLALFAHFLWVYYCGGTPVDLQTYLICLAVCEALVGLLHYLARRFGMDTEFISGYVTEVRHYRFWTERVVTYVTVTDSRGNSHTEERISFVEHPEYWEWSLNTGHIEDIGSRTFDRLVNQWGGSTDYFDTYHPNCVAGGGGDKCEYDYKFDHIETQTYAQAYDNPLDQSNSIFRYDEISDKKAQELGLYKYPEIDGYEQNPVVGLNLATYSDQWDFQVLNATEGQNHQIHFFVLLYSADKGLNIAELQRAYWHGGNKNEFTICLGVDFKDDTPILKWCNAFSWMDEPTMEVALESWARDHADQPLSLHDFCFWLRDNIGLWRRKEWKDFKYIANPMHGWQLVILFGGTLLVCAAAIYLLLNLN